MDLRNYEFYKTSGAPVSGALVEVWDAVDGTPGGAPITNTTTTSNGRWEFLGLTDTPKDVRVTLTGSYRWYKGLTKTDVDQIQVTKYRGPVLTNQLVNGGFDVWQRGTAFGTTGVYTADRWIMQIVGTDALSVSRDTANRDVGSVADAWLSFTLGTGGGSTGIYQQLKMSESQLAGKTVSASMRIKTTLANAARFQVSSDGTGAVAVVSGFHTGGGVYQTLTVTYAVPADATLVQIQVLLSAGTTQAFYVDNAMLVVSPVPVDYAPLSPADDLARCLRYYQRWTSNGGVLATGQCISATSALINIPLLAQMGGNPTMTTSGLANMAITNASGAVIGCSSFAVSVVLPTTLTVVAGVNTGLVAGNATQLAPSNTGWIAVEWNP